MGKGDMGISLHTFSPFQRTLWTHPKAQKWALTLPHPKSLPKIHLVKTAISAGGGKVGFTKMVISGANQLGFQRFLYGWKALFKLYNFLEEVEL